MNDKTVINTISTIYFTIVSFLSFIFLTLSAAFIILQNGLYIDGISLPNFKVKQLYIKWNEKVDVSIKEIVVNTKETDNSSEIRLEDIRHYLKQLSLLDSWFESITVEEIIFNDMVASFKYKDQKRGYLVVSSPDFYFKSSLYFESHMFNVHVDNFLDIKRKIDINGTLFFNMPKLEVFADLSMDINNDLDTQILLSANADRLDYKLKVKKDVKNITHLINIANLPKEARYWALDAIDMSHTTINSATGFVEFDKIDEAYKNIKVIATVNKMNYTYNKELDSIHTQKTILEFKKGILFIYPKEAYSYGMYLNKSWLKIDFTQKNELLTLYLLFDGKLNKEMLKILNAYKIKLPFLQKEGTVTTDLKLAVDLMSLDVDVRGDFFAKKANFDYLGLNIDVFDAYIKLNNNRVSVDNMKAKYKDIATTNVDVRFDARESKGVITFNPEYIGFGNTTLQHNALPVEIVYNIDPNNDTINITKSQWKHKDIFLSIDKISVPFNLDKLLVEVPATYVEAEGIGSGFISGAVPIDTMKMSLRADILKLNYKGVELSQSYTPLNISYDEKLHISSHGNILFSVDDTEFDLSNLAVDIGSDTFDLNHADLLSIDGLLAVQLNASYSDIDKTGTVELKNLKIEDEGQSLYEKDEILFLFSVANNSIRASSSKLGLKLNTTESGWSAKLKDISSLYKDSQFLQNFKLEEGNINFSKKESESSIRFNAYIKYPYGLLVENRVPLHSYKIKGKINSKKSFLNINNKINVKVTDRVKVNIKDSVINVSALLDAIGDINSSSEKGNAKSVTVGALNSHLYLGNNRRIVYDKVELQHHNSITTAQLEHKKGFAGLKLDSKNFHLYGENFGDDFMENLFSLSRFRGGNFNFSMNGEIGNYDGLFYISDTTMLDYKMINNILAFVNTVPSLATFSLPGYSKTGLKVSSAYMNFNAKDSVFNISDFFLDSKEIDILGSGVADIPKDKVDVVLNLKTDLGSNVSKIPLVGYVIFGKDSISTTMSITGKLSNPKVKSLIAKDILVAPINIVKRALLLPYDLLKKEDNSSK